MKWPLGRRARNRSDILVLEAVLYVYVITETWKFDPSGLYSYIVRYSTNSYRKQEMEYYHFQWNSGCTSPTVKILQCQFNEPCLKFDLIPPPAIPWNIGENLWWLSIIVIIACCGAAGVGISYMRHKHLWLWNAKTGKYRINISKKSKFPYFTLIKKSRTAVDSSDNTSRASTSHGENAGNHSIDNPGELGGETNVQVHTNDTGNEVKENENPDFETKLQVNPVDGKSTAIEGQGDKNEVTSFTEVRENERNLTPVGS
ncbi:uncharacterized protein LOC144432539 [Glandiceps talaboti]